MKLALRLGRTLEELGRTMSAQEFGLWLELYQQDPFDETRSDLQIGIIAATIANYAGKVRSDQVPPATPLDFMPCQSANAAPAAEDEPDPIAHFKQFQ